MKLQLNPTTYALLALTFQLARADLSYYCEMSKDKSNMIQKAYCCDDLVPARYAEQFFQAEKCTLADPQTVGDSCPHDGMAPVCCYTTVSLLFLSAFGSGALG
ncbi:hypothetical protein CNMCM5623_002199 [Aspergillus felis]|uniref:Hydrophobin n=1 Tax=Aspergillus felis TaxID=1287682 RepID=A0A8H6UZ42_9EURO|nr:hypothetical protein CNMCM5623_002199 [Aspergillus felis]